jgi:hypothetical protein
MPNRSPHRNPKSLGNAQLSCAFRPQIRPLDSAKTLFFERDAMAIKESPERAAAARNPSLSHRCNNLVQRSVRLLGNQGKDALAIVFQDRTATAARFRRTHPVITPALQPFDRRTGADLKALGRLTPRRPRFHTASITRSRRSPDSAFGIVVAPTGESMLIDSLNQTAKRIPRIQIQRNML